MISLQQIFDSSWQHFIVQNNLPATNDDGLAKYQDGCGRRCPIGLVLPDGHPALQSGRKFSSLVKTYPSLFDKQIRNMTPAELNKFQGHLHDDLLEPGEANAWKMDLDARRKIYISTARLFKLKAPRGVGV